MTARRALFALLVAPCVGCGPDYVLGDCPSGLLINEVEASSEHEALPGWSRITDWVEIVNPSDEEVRVRGHYLSRTWREHEYEIQTPTIAPHGTLLLVANTYDIPDPGVPDDVEITGFDLNRDGDGVYLRSPSFVGHSLCDAAVYPDQHADFSWSRDRDDPEVWCATVPTPDAPNDSCFCDGDGDC